MQLRAICKSKIHHARVTEANVEYVGSIAVDSEDLVRQMAQGKTLGGLRPGEAAIDTDLEIVENEGRMGLEAPGPLQESSSKGKGLKGQDQRVNSLTDVSRWCCHLDCQKAVRPRPSISRCRDRNPA